jgi:hypothetical protein
VTCPTAPALIAAVLAVITALLIHADQRGGRTTDPHDPPDGEQP